MANFELLSELLHDTGGKILLLVMDGLGGLPRTAYGLTELETARTPNMDAPFFTATPRDVMVPAS